MARQYKMNKRLDKAYETYNKMYKAKQASLRKQGYEMFLPKFNKREYLANRQAYVDMGVKNNINQTIVSEQAYKYKMNEARGFRKVAKELDLSQQNLSIADLRRADLDLSELNNKLKELTTNEYNELFNDLPEEVKHSNQGFISYMVFGSL